MARHHRRYSAEQWATLISEQQTCGDPIDVFCVRKGVGVSTFAKWRRRLLRGSAMPSHGAADKPRGFVEAVPLSNAAVSLVLSGGVRLELPLSLGPEVIADFAHAVATRGRG